MSKVKSSRQRWILARMREGAWLAEDRDAFMEVSTYELLTKRIHEGIEQTVVLGYISERVIEKMADAGLIMLADDGREIRRHGKFVTTEWDYFLPDDPRCQPEPGTESEESDETTVNTGSGHE